MASGLALSRTGYSFVPIFVVPVGRMTFWVEIAARHVARREAPGVERAGSMSTMICRCLPPYGQGICVPWMVAMSARTKLMP